jgi:RND superfamily putative drug exporter
MAGRNRRTRRRAGAHRPPLEIRLGFPDAKNDPPSYTTRQAYDLLDDGFGPGFSAPMLLTVQGKSGRELLTSANAVGAELRALTGAAVVAPAIVNAAGDTPLLGLTPRTSPQDEATQDLVNALREESIPAATSGTGLTVHVGGLVPANVDTNRGSRTGCPTSSAACC